MAALLVNPSQLNFQSPPAFGKEGFHRLCGPCSFHVSASASSVSEQCSRDRSARRSRRGLGSVRGAVEAANLKGHGSAGMTWTSAGQGGCHLPIPQQLQLEALRSRRYSAVQRSCRQHDTPFSTGAGRRVSMCRTCMPLSCSFTAIVRGQPARQENGAAATVFWRLLPSFCSSKCYQDCLPICQRKLAEVVGGGCIKRSTHDLIRHYVRPLSSQLATLRCSGVW